MSTMRIKVLLIQYEINCNRVELIMYIFWVNIDSYHTSQPLLHLGYFMYNRRQTD